MKKISLFLDSGAFSAWSQSKQINIQEYIDFIKENKNYIDVYANLDVIGDAEATWRNQRLMERRGLNPLPVYHTGYGEDVKYLYQCLEYDYFCLGGMVGTSTLSLRSCLDDIWPFIIGKDGIPKAKVHAFGMTSLPLMRRYPWYSVDSTSWILTSRLGAVYIPKMVRGEWDYFHNPLKIFFSSKSPAGDDIDNPQSYYALSEGEREVIDQYLDYRGYCVGTSVIRTENRNYKLKDGERWYDNKPNGDNRRVEQVLVEGLGNSYRARDEMNILYFLDLEKSFPKWPWPWQPPTKRKRGLF